MVAFISKIASKKFLPIAWTILTIGLLCLPGSVIPGMGLFGIKHLDKIAHVILFGGIVLLWTGYYCKYGIFARQLLISALITILSICLGVIMEYVQLNYIPNRSFDKGDILADAVGSIGVFIFFLIQKE
jgi:hypothetical protein